MPSIRVTLRRVRVLTLAPQCRCLSMQTTSEQQTVYLTTVEAARYLKLSRHFLEVARHRGDGSGPEFIKLARAVRYQRSALDAWMAAHRHPANKPVRKAVR